MSDRALPKKHTFHYSHERGRASTEEKERKEPHSHGGGGGVLVRREFNHAVSNGRRVRRGALGSERRQQVAQHLAQVDARLARFAFFRGGSGTADWEEEEEAGV